MSLILLASPTKDHAILQETMRRRGNAVELICNCCRLPFSEELRHQQTGLAERINIYSRHYGKTHTNSIRLENTEVVVTDRKEFVIVPSAEVIKRLQRAA